MNNNDQQTQEEIVIGTTNSNKKTRSDVIKELIQTSRTGINDFYLEALEEIFNETWTKYDICLVLTGTHILDRLCRDEHKRNPITGQEFARILMEFTRRYSWFFAGLPPEKESYGVIYEPFSQINIGFVLRPGVGISGFGRDLMLQTILRKNNFFTKDRVYQV